MRIIKAAFVLFISVTLATGLQPTLARSQKIIHNYSPAWSSDSLHIAFISDRDGNSEVYIMDADGTHQVNLTQNAANDVMLQWSPDGQRLAFVSDRAGNPQLYLLNADGSNSRRSCPTMCGIIAGRQIVDA